jgi:hypothetical protein
MTAHGEVGDPQVRTDHPWYPGELACSNFERLQKTHAELYERVVGQSPKTDEQKVLAAWLWRNTHYWHGEPGVENIWGKGFQNNTDTSTRDYWTGLFADGFSLCGTTHAQWIGEMEQLLGHNRARVVGVSGHNSFEVFLTGGEYGAGRWALLDHDVSTVIFNDAGTRLLSIAEIKKDVNRLTTKNTAATKQHGWKVCGLHAGDGGAYDSFQSAEYLAGYSGPPPMVHLRQGETLRRYLQPGLEDGKTFVFWGRNYNTAGVPGPERSRTWVNQPEKMYGSKEGTPHRDGQARYANAVFTYQPDFKTEDYREGVIEETDAHVIFEFQSPYLIAATPGNDGPWGIYDPGCRNGLVASCNKRVEVSISVDRGQSWNYCGFMDNSLDLTDYCKGYRQYFLKVHAPRKTLTDAELKFVTVCQANSSVIPQLKDGGSIIHFATSGTAIDSIGPTLAQAKSAVVAGAFESPKVTLQAVPPRNAKAVEVYAIAQVASSNPPSPEVAYQIEYSLDQGKAWQPMLKDWRITRQGEEPPDFWSQSFCWASTKLKEPAAGPIQVRFANNGGKRYRRAELHVAYKVPKQDATKVTFAWKDDAGEHEASHVFSPNEGADWTIPTGKNVITKAVTFSANSQ